MKSIYVEIYHQRLYDDQQRLRVVKHSLEFDGKEFKVLGMIPHASKIIIDKENIDILRSILDKIENKKCHPRCSHPKKHKVKQKARKSKEKDVKKNLPDIINMSMFPGYYN